MLTDMLTADEAVRQIELAVASHRRVLGVDGFRIVPEGYMAALDLILDVSDEQMTIDAAAAKTVDFIRSNAASDVVFEVVIADAAGNAPIADIAGPAQYRQMRMPSPAVTCLLIGALIGLLLWILGESTLVGWSTDQPVFSGVDR